MIPVSTVAIVALLYHGLLFAAACWADRRREAGRSIVSNPLVYALSIAVYYSAWGFYGNVGGAATVGLDFIALDLSPILMIFAWWLLLRKIVRISKEEKISSIADFISSRYGKSHFLGALVTLFTLVGIMPYIALQLKAVVRSFEILTGSPAGDTAFIVALVLGIFAVLFGARRLDASGRHEGLVAVIALSSLVKLVAVLSVGFFVTYGLFDGFTDIFARFAVQFPERKALLQLGSEQIPYTGWFTLVLLSVMSILLLPRQFHVTVIENADENQIGGAMWGFPAYSFLFDLFVIPIALGGLVLTGGDTNYADFFLLHIPLQTGHPWLALLVFIGGISAAGAMVLVSSVAISTMIFNSLVMPIVLRLRIPVADISQTLVNTKRLGILTVILLGYFFNKFFGDSYALIRIGLVSFAAAAQFAPSFFGGLFWKKANLRGAAVGMILGFVLWFYTLLIPLFARSGWLDERLLEEGPFGLEILKPLELFGLSGLDMWSHSLFWTLFFNLGAFVFFSLFTGAMKGESDQASKFVDAFAPPAPEGGLKRLTKPLTVMEFVDLMTKFIGEKQAQTAIAEYMEHREVEVDARGSISEYDLPDLKHFTERTLAASIGAAPARTLIENYLAARGSEMEDVFDIFGSVTISRSAGREQLGVLHETTRIVAGGADLQSIFDKVLELFRQQFRFDLCVIRLFDEERNLLTVRSQKGMSSRHFGLAEREPTTDSYVGTTFLHNSVTVVNDTGFLDKPGSALLIHREGIRSFAHAPIEIEGRPIGVLSTFSKSERGIFSDEFIGLYQSLAGQIAVAWRNARQAEEIIHAREKEREMQIARTIQLGLLPARPPTLEGVSLAGTCVPAKEVGGDYYDFLPRGKEELDLVIADVSGHSVGAALTMGWIRTFIQDRARSKRIRGAGEILSDLNEFFYEDLANAELFVTMFYVKYISPSGELSFASAGHNPPLLWRSASEEFESLDAEGLILGVMKKVVFEEKRVTLEAGDILLLYTDGITEAESPEGAFFGEDRLCDLVKEYRHLPPEEMIENLLRQARLFTGTSSFNDDVSLVVMRAEEPSTPPPA